MIISGQGVMLGRKDEQGTAALVGTKVQPFDSSAPDDYRYDTQPPLFERVQPWNDLSLGFGLRKQDGYQDRKYRYARGVDLSIAGQMVKGPDIATFTPATTDATNGAHSFFFELGGSLFCAVGRYILKRVNDASWTMEEDFGASAYVLDAKVFSSNATGTTLAWVALSGSNVAQYSSDGSAWTAMATHVSLAYAQVGSEFYRASDTNQLSKVDVNANPTVEANWTNANSFRVGDKSSPIVSLTVTATGALLILKGDGVYTVDDAGDDHRLFGSVAGGGIGSDTDNGRWSGIFGNDIYFTYGKQHMRAAPAQSFASAYLTVEEIGPEKLTENDSTVRGRITAFQADGALGAYAGLYNDDTSTSYIVKFGSWLTPGISNGQLDEAKRIDVWHGSLDAPLANGNAQFASKKIVALWRSTVGATSNHYRLYGACSDGSLFWWALPCVPNPMGCTDYRYTTLDAYLYLPLWHGTFEADAKALRSVSVLSTSMSTTNYVQWSYKTDPTVSDYIALGTNFTNPVRQRQDFPNNTGVYLADFRVTFVNAATTSTPQVTAITIHHAVRPALILLYSFSVLVSDGLVKRNGSPFKSIGAVQMRTIIKNAAGALGSVTAVLPDESSQQLTFTHYAENLAWDERLRRWGGSLDCQAVQYLTNTQYGTWLRVSAYRWQDGLSYNWLQIMGI